MYALQRITYTDWSGVFIPTSSADKLYQSARSLVEGRQGLLAVGGPPGSGKSSALVWLLSRLKQTLDEPIATLHFQASVVQLPHEHFARSLYDALEAASCLKNTGENIRVLLCFALSDYCLRCKSGKLLIAIDDADQFGEEPMNELEQLSACLEPFGVTLFAIFFCRFLPLDAPVRNSGAFKRLSMAFSGLSSVSDVSNWLTTRLATPSDHLPTLDPLLEYVRAQNVSTAELSDCLWQEFRLYQSALDFTSWRMDAFLEALQWISDSLSANSGVLDKRLVKRAVAASGLWGPQGALVP